MPNRFEQIAESVREKTNAELAEDLAKLTPLTQDKLARLLPTKADKENMARLMAIVTGSTNHNQKITALRDNIDDLGGVVLKVLGAVL